MRLSVCLPEPVLHSFRPCPLGRLNRFPTWLERSESSRVSQGIRWEYGDFPAEGYGSGRSVSFVACGCSHIQTRTVSRGQPHGHLGDVWFRSLGRLVTKLAVPTSAAIGIRGYL